MRESEAMYQSELIAITQVQKEEGSSQERSGLHAYLANQCFATYRAHFAGQARTSRRLATLERLNAQLDVIAEQMDAIISSARDQDFDRDQAQKNREIVRDHLNSYREEERAIDQAQIALDYDGWVNVLRESGERIFEAYNQNFANKPRSGCDPELLCQLCDRLYDTALQLRPFVEYSPEPEERGQLLIMLDQLRLYQRELTLVREATGVSKA